MYFKFFIFCYLVMSHRDFNGQQLFDQFCFNINFN